MQGTIILRSYIIGALGVLGCAECWLILKNVIAQRWFLRTCTQMYEEIKYIMSCTIVVTSSSCVMMMVHQSIWKISEVCDKEKGISYLSASIVFYHASNVSFDGGISTIGKNILSNI